MSYSPLYRRSGIRGDSARRQLAWLEAGAKHPAEALRHFLSMQNSFVRPIAFYGAALMHEELGQPEQARTYWARLVKLTEKGEALPRIAEARQALARSAREQ